METRITATELVRSLGDILGRIRYRGERFVIERNGTPVARLEPLPSGAPTTVGAALRAWRAAAEPEPSFADDLAAVASADRPPSSPWDS